MDIEGNQYTQTRAHLLQAEIRMMKSEMTRLAYEQNMMREKIQENREKIKINKQLPYLVASVTELIDMENKDEDKKNRGEKKRSAIVSTSTKLSVFLPNPGLVPSKSLEPGSVVGVNKDSYLILSKLSAEHDPKIKAMEVDNKPTEDYNDIGGLDKQIEELVEAIVLPMTHADRFIKLGIKAPKGVLMYGPPGTGKTLLARACAAQTESTFLKLAASQLNQMYIGDGARMVRDAFKLAKEKAPTIIFIDELDAVGTKRFDSDKTGDREIQRTMLELLNQMDGFGSDDRIKVIAATNRVDILDPALLRSGRFDRKIRFPNPDKDARIRILQIHSRKMVLGNGINFDEISRSCEDFNGAQCKAICAEAGMIALRRNGSTVQHEDFLEGIIEVQGKKKGQLSYFV
eukprot:GHVP01051028.1.p1 GENE.GHVP01051028.1~~GHVP01051028.1.p1  ORF type:complete len:402 (+),score=81.91 GHVP01051028.1:2569-3774(+)